MIAKPLFEALMAQWRAMGLADALSGGLYNGPPPSRSAVKRPYLVLDNEVEQFQLQSGKGFYHTVNFDATVVADDKDQAGQLASQLAGVIALVKAQLPIVMSDGSKLQGLLPGRGVYTEELTYWQATQEFVARTAS